MLLARLPFYLIEAALLGIFMISACSFGIALEHPDSQLRHAINSGFARRALMGTAMGLTAVVLIYSPWGKRSGPHMNPAMTLAFVRLRRIEPIDAAWYIAAQFVGGTIGVLAMSLLLGPKVMHPAVRYVATLPGAHGLGAAWFAEFAIAFVMLTMVLSVNRIPRLVPFTGLFAGSLVMLYITFEAPISGMSLNPARTFASAFVARLWTGWWIYFTAPPIGMLAAIELQKLISRAPHKLCGKLSHSRTVSCIFTCDCLARGENT
jgi:aquaporin Z